MIWGALCTTPGPRRDSRIMDHVPVLRDEVLRFLLAGDARVIFDGTVGAGMHAEALLDAGPRISLVGVDRDPDALEIARARLARFGDRVSLSLGSYSDLQRIFAGDRVDGVLLDLGISSMQIDRTERGFGYRSEGPLDMRMGKSGETAAILLSRLDVRGTAKMLWTLGDVKSAGAISRAIARAVASGRMNTTADLRSAVASGLKRGARPAELSRVFQAVRIAVNSELDLLDAFLSGVMDVVRPNARIAVISYHSLEDRRIKTFFKDKSAICICPPEVPICVCDHKATLNILTRRAVRPTEIEIEANPRARSARMRVAQVIEEIAQ